VLARPRGASKTEFISLAVRVLPGRARDITASLIQSLGHGEQAS